MREETRTAKKEKLSELKERQKQNKLRQLELSASKKELMRLVVDELKEHEAKVV